jgi:tRNA(Ile2) C34 agmatinyltransferase TiaS
MDDERAPICPACGVTMIPAELSGLDERSGDWICAECEETSEPEIA